MTVAWNAIAQAAIKTWVTSATGLAAAKVIMTGQGGPRPAPPFVEVAVDIAGIGQDWVDNEDDPDDAGATIYTARGTRRLTLTFVCYAASQAALTSALGYLEAVRSALVLPSVNDALDAAGIGIGEIGPAVSMGEIVAAQWEPRGRMEATGFMASEITEAGSYIETVEVEGTIDD